MPVQRSPPRTPRRESASAANLEGDIEELCRTLDRSRKRHLSVGLLRGDQVQDRLLEQESSASPLLKKSKLKVPTATPGPTRRSTPDPVTQSSPEPEVSVLEPAVPELTPRDTAAEMAMTMAQFKEYMDNNTNLRLENIDRTVAGLRTDVRSNTAKIDAQETLVRQNQRNISELRSELEKVRSLPVPTVPASWPHKTTPAPASTPPDPTAADVQEYMKARRSLRLWPIPGAQQNELWSSARAFITDKLTSPDLQHDSIESVSRVQIPSGPGVQLEALVTFRDAGTRDLVIGCASKLANCMDGNGKPTAGMRIEVPQSLQQDFRVLFKYGQTLRARHGQGTRRHVKFDDVSRSLYLNVRLPGDEAWSRVSTSLALKGVRARQTMNDGELERRLDITGPLAPPQRPRAASLAELPMAVDNWNTRRPSSS